MEAGARVLKRTPVPFLGVLVLTAALSLFLGACSSSSNNSSGSGGISKLKVGLVTDVGKIDDKSFNQSAWDGVQQAKKDLGADVKFIETQDPKDYAKNIDQFAADKYNVIVTVGFALGDATVAAAKKYPNIKFIGVDQFQSATLPNLAGLVFDEDKAGYLAGALAAQMSKSGTIGQVLGTNTVPPVVKYGKGFEAGAKSVKPDVKVLTWYNPADISKAFNDPELGKQQALQEISQGADIVFAAAGNTGNGALQGAASKNTFCIGVDSDQYNTVPEARKFLLTSAMKLIQPGVVDIIKTAKNGTFKGGNVAGQVGIAPFHDLDAQIPQPVKDKMKQIEQGLTNGSIKTGVTV
jgi:basic membrane protein A